jgi:hypothetical protein
LIGLCRNFISTSGYPFLCSAIAIDLLVLVLYSHRDIKAYDFQSRLKIIDFDITMRVKGIPVNDTVLLKIRQALDEAQAQLGSLAFK